MAKEQAAQYESRLQARTDMLQSLHATVRPLHSQHQATLRELGAAAGLTRAVAATAESKVSGQRHLRKQVSVLAQAVEELEGLAGQLAGALEGEQARRAAAEARVQGLEAAAQQLQVERVAMQGQFIKLQQQLQAAQEAAQTAVGEEARHAAELAGAAEEVAEAGRRAASAEQQAAVAAIKLRSAQQVGQQAEVHSQELQARLDQGEGCK